MHDGNMTMLIPSDAISFLAKFQNGRFYQKCIYFISNYILFVFFIFNTYFNLIFYTLFAYFSSFLILVFFGFVIFN